MNQHTHCANCSHIYQDHAEGECHGCATCIAEPGHFLTGKYEKCSCVKFEEAA